MFLRFKISSIMAFAAALASVNAMQGCSLAQPEKKLLRIEIPARADFAAKASASYYSKYADPLAFLQPQGAAALIAPASIFSFNCFALNVTGPDIPVDNRMQCKDPVDVIGIAGGAVPASGGIVEVMVPSGSNRKLELMGFDGTGTDCLPMGQVFDAVAAELNGGPSADPLTEPLGKPWLLAETVVDIVGDTTITMDVSQNTASARELFQSCGVQEPSPSPSPSPSASPSPSPTPTPTPLNVVISLSGSQPSNTAILPVEFTVSFSQVINTTTFDESDITQSGTATGVAWSLSIIDQMTYTLTATAVGTQGTIIPTIPASVVWDTSSNPNEASTGSATVAFDNTPPGTPSGLALIDPVSSPGIDATPTIRVSGVTSGDSIELHSNGTCTSLKSKVTATSATIDMASSALTDGSYVFYAKAIDNAGNSSNCSSVSVAYVLDTAVVSVTGLSDDAVAKQTKAWAWGCSKASCTYRYIIDQVFGTLPVTGYVATTTGSQTSGTGTYYIHVQAKDEAGNESAVVTVSAVLDNTAPGMPSGLSLVTPASSPNNDTAPTIQVSGVTSGNTVELYSDSACSSLVATGTAADITIHLTPSALSDAIYNFYAKAIDNAGNTSACSSATISYQVDTVISAPGGVDDKTWWNSTSTSPSIIWNTVSDSGSGLNRYEVALGSTSGSTDIVSWTSSGSTPAKQFTVTLAEADIYYASVRAVDNAGNVSSIAYGDGFTVDVTGPSAPTGITLGAIPGTLELSPPITYDPAGDVGSGTIGHEAKIVRASDLAIIHDWTAHSTGAVVGGLSLEGNTQYSVSVRGKDLAGNIGAPSSSVTWTTQPDPCTSTIGSICAGGARYAGEFGGYKYMVTPSGCSDIPSGSSSLGGSVFSDYPLTDFTPICAGTTDALQKYWNEGITNSYDIPEVETIISATQPSTELGSVNTAAIASITTPAYGGYHAAARYCDRLNYGGYTDWFLPSKSELAYLYCHSDSGGTHTTSYPQEDPNCTSYGGKTYQLTGFAMSNYASSTESDAGYVWTQNFAGGLQSFPVKNNPYYIRCVRSFIP